MKIEDDECGQSYSHLVSIFADVEERRNEREESLTFILASS
jgi:hypothetical protein